MKVFAYAVAKILVLWMVASAAILVLMMVIPQQSEAKMKRPWTRMFASWYGPGLYGGGLACGGSLRQGMVIVAHKDLPCGSLLRICYRRRCINAPVRDRGPFIAGRDIDLGPGVASHLRFSGLGTVKVRVLRMGRRLRHR